MENKNIQMKNTEALLLRCDKKIRMMLEELAKDDERSQNAELRQLIRAEYLRRHPKSVDSIR